MEIQRIFDRVQHEKAKHKEHLKMLHDVYHKYEFEDFFNEFNKYLLLAFAQHPSHSFAKSLITFVSSFCLKIVSDYEKNMKTNEGVEYEAHPFFMKLMSEVLKCVPLNNFNVRYHACELLAMLFSGFGTDITISDVICDRIQRAMLKRSMEDPKPQIRTLAVKVLTRLQNPCDVSCPVIQSFINSLGDPSAAVRKIVIENIAPCRCTFDHIISRVRDVDPIVRTATYIRLSKFSPRLLSIVYRQSIIMSGLLESNAAVKRTFQQVLLPKWLEIYNSNILQFMLALKLDANEEDIIQTEEIYEKLLPIIFKTMSLQELVELLKLNDSKVVPAEELSTEKVTYWCCLVGYLMEIDPTDTEFEDVIPPVVNISACIENFVKLKSVTSLDRWEYLEYQQTLRKLIELMTKLDNSDEFGRQAMQKLLVYILTNVKLEYRVLGMVINAFHVIVVDVDKLAYELCSIIADIKDPLEPVEIPIEVRRNQDVQIAQLKVKIHIITDELKKAIEEKQFELVGKLSRESEYLEKQIKELEDKFSQDAMLVRKPHNDMDTVCRCLDVIISFIENVPIEKLPISLITLREEFLGNDEIDVRCSGIYQRIFKLSCLYSLVDKNIARQSLETISTPLIGYRVSSIFDKKILEISVGAISDLIRIYGPDIFEGFSTKQADKTNESNCKRGNDRTLYCQEDYDMETEKFSTIKAANTSNIFIDIMLSMLDDNDPDLRTYVAIALSKLVVRGLCVNSSLITRLLLKWFNPILDTDDKYDQKMQRYIGTALTKYIHDIKGASSILEKAIIPTLCYIGNAPKTSPLVEVNYDDLLHCLIKFTKIKETTTVDVHKHLAYSILRRLAETNERSERILTKMLALLDRPQDEPNVIIELSQLVSLAQDKVTDKVALTSLRKYFTKLNGIGSENDTANTVTNTTDATVGDILTSTNCDGDRTRKRKEHHSITSDNIMDNNLTTIEEAVDSLTMNGDAQPAGTSAKSPLDVRKVLFPRRSRRIRETNGSDSDNREEHSREKDGVDSYDIQTPTTSDSPKSTHSSCTEAQITTRVNKVTSAKRKKTRKTRSDI